MIERRTIKELDIDDNEDIIVKYEYSDDKLSILLWDCGKNTQVLNEETVKAVERVINNELKNGFTDLIYKKIEFFKKLNIKIDVNNINFSNIYDSSQAIELYEILREFKALDDNIKSNLKQLILNYVNPHDAYIIRKLLIDAIMRNDKEFVEFLIKDLFGKLLVGLFDNEGVVDAFNKWLKGKGHPYFNVFSYNVDILYIIFSNNLEHLIENEIKVFRENLIKLVKKKKVNLETLLASRMKSKSRNIIITLMKVLDENKRFFPRKIKRRTKEGEVEKIKSIAVDGEDIVVKYKRSSVNFYDLIEEFREDVKVLNPKVIKIIKEYVNSKLIHRDISYVYENLDFLKNIPIKIDTSKINFDEIYNLGDLINLYEILCTLNSLDDNTKRTLEKLILNDREIYIKVYLIRDSLAVALERDNKEFLEFTIKKLLGGILVKGFGYISESIVRWFNRTADEYDAFSHILYTLRMVYDRGLEHLISDEIKVFKEKFENLAKSMNINLKRLLKKRLESKYKDDAVVLIKVLGYEDLKPYMVKALLGGGADA